MDEWAKTLLTTGAGFLAGVAAEPLKIRVTTWARTGLIRRSLYSDLGRIYHVLNRFYDLCEGPNGFESTTEQDRGRAVAWLRTAGSDLFRHYQEKEGAILLSLPEYEALASTYETVNNARSSADGAWDQQYAAVMRVFEAFDQAFRRGALNSKRLLHYRSKHRKRTVREVTSYHQASSRDDFPLIRDSRASLKSQQGTGRITIKADRDWFGR